MANFFLTAPDASTRQTTIIDDPVKVEARLRGLHQDLSSVLLYEVIQAGLTSRNETLFPASAPIAPSMQQWLKSTEELRGRLAARKWRIKDDLNCPFIISPDRSIALVPMTGNKYTGKNGIENPKNQAPKGTVTQAYVQGNVQLDLINQDYSEAIQKKQDETQVWVLLYHYDHDLKEVRYELSLPSGYDKKRITNWRERLIFPAIPNDPDKQTIFESEPTEPVTVNVEPKAI